jgi:hypothetical protein
MRTLIQHVTEQAVDAAIVDQLAEPSAITSTLSPASDDVSYQAVTLLSSEMLNTPGRDIPMEASMEAQGTLEPPEAEEVVMWGMSCPPSPPLPCPWVLRDQEDVDEPTLGIE